MIRRPPRSTLDRSSAASDVYKRQIHDYHDLGVICGAGVETELVCDVERPDWDWIDNYRSTEADGYLVPSTLARGGEIIKEVWCTSAQASCQFPNYAGTVSWKLGFQVYRDFPVKDDGGELTYQELINPAMGAFNWDNGTHRVRFDHKRAGLFHYVLYAHSRGRPKS